MTLVELTADQGEGGVLAAIARELKSQFPEVRGERGSAAFYKALALEALRRGIAPNKNMLYVAAGRRGSMSTAESGLVRAMQLVARILPSIDRPGIPDEFRDDVAEMFAGICARADAIAAARFQADRSELESSLAQSQAAAEAARDELERVHGQLRDLELRLRAEEAQSTQLRDREQRLTAELASAVQLRDQALDEARASRRLAEQQSQHYQSAMNEMSQHAESQLREQKATFEQRLKQAADSAAHEREMAIAHKARTATVLAEKAALEERLRACEAAGAVAEQGTRELRSTNHALQDLTKSQAQQVDRLIAQVGDARRSGVEEATAEMRSKLIDLVVSMAKSSAGKTAAREFLRAAKRVRADWHTPLRAHLVSAYPELGEDP